MSKIQFIHENTDTASPNSTECCSICLSNIQEEMKIQECQHSFCKDCLQEYLRTETNSLNVLKINCAEQACSYILTPSDIEEILGTSDFERYQNLFLQKTAKRTQDLICPQPACSRIIIPTNNSLLTKCDCEAVICNLCRNLDHPDKTCIAALDPEFETYAAENDLKMCLMCKTVISRVEGCIHITCSVCDYDWCWLCGREYTESHDSECSRIWSPLPPRHCLKENSQGYLKKIGIFFFNITKFVFNVIILQLFFPYILLDVFPEIRQPDRPRGYKIKLIFIAVLMHLVYLFAEAGLSYLMIKYPPNRIALSICMLLFAFLPWGMKIMFYFVLPKETQKRWMSGNVQTFHYTPANKPQDSENPDLGAQVQLNELAKLSDQENIFPSETQISSQKSDAFDDVSLLPK